MLEKNPWVIWEKNQSKGFTPKNKGLEHVAGQQAIGEWKQGLGKGGRSMKGGQVMIASPLFKQLNIYMREIWFTMQMLIKAKDGTTPKLGARNSIQVPYVGGRDPIARTIMAASRDLLE